MCDEDAEARVAQNHMFNVGAIAAEPSSCWPLDPVPTYYRRKLGRIKVSGPNASEQKIGSEISSGRDKKTGTLKLCFNADGDQRK